MDNTNDTNQSAQQQKRQTKPLNKKLLLGLLVLIVVLAAILIYLIPGVSAPKNNFTAYDNVPVPQHLISELMVPDNISNVVGIGVAPKLTKVNGTPLTMNGKPEILYVGADFCPYCAAERWPLAIALMRFGSFSGLKLMTSSPTDYAPSTPTFTFYNATYTSQYVSFVSVELTKNKMVNGSYPVLQTLNATELAIAGAYDSGGSTPFIDFANQTVRVGSSYDPKSILEKYNWSVIAADLYNTSTLQSESIMGAANIYTAEICKLDGSQPQSVCSQPYVKAING